jgi:MarR family 2-MHQ and catechol resistance regulon transcriptional repressor
MSRNTIPDPKGSGTHLWLVLWKTYGAMRAFAEESIASLGLSLTDFAILELLLHKGPLPVNDIGKKISLTSGSMTVAVDRLASRGVVERKSGGDRRTRIVHLTEQGKSLIECAFARHASSLDSLGDALSPDERQQAMRLLKKLGRAAESSLVGSSSSRRPEDHHEG